MDGLKEMLTRLHEKPGDVFEETLKKDGLIVAPGVYDAMGAHIATRIHNELKTTGKYCSYNAVYGGGWSISAMLWRKPDMGFHDLSEMTLIGKHIIANAYPLPVIFDAEAGFGSAVTLTKTVEAYHAMGVALAHLEDQDESATRRCGNLGGKRCVEPEVMVAKIKSWLEATKALGSSMRLMVRTDALTAAGGGLENAIDRAKRYMDVEYQGLRPMVLWADAMIDPKVIDRWIEEMRKHDPNMILGVNYSPNKDWAEYYHSKYQKQPPTYEELYRGGQGFRVIWHTILQARADMEAGWRTFEDMAQNGAEALWKLHERQRGQPYADTQGMSGAKEWQAYDEHIGGDEAADRYKNSEGYKG